MKYFPPFVSLDNIMYVLKHQINKVSFWSNMMLFNLQRIITRYRQMLLNYVNHFLVNHSNLFLIIL